MRPPSNFAEYANSPGLTPDEIFMVELLMEHVKYELDPAYARVWSERSDARSQPDYVPHFPAELVDAAAKALSSVTSLFLPKQWGDVRPIRDITALGWLPQLTSLHLSGHEIADISPLRFCGNLERLELPLYPVRDLSALRECRRLKKLALSPGPFADLSTLAACHDLEELQITGTVNDLSVLSSFRKLWRLSLHCDSLAAFGQLGELPVLRELNLACRENLDSFRGLPFMPALQILTGPSVNDLRGVENFPNVRNLMALSGGFSSLEPLWRLKNLTHLDIQKSGLQSLETVSRIHALRQFEFRSDLPGLSLEPLKRLPALHQVQFWLPEEYAPAINELKEWLTPWDTEFLSKQARHTPSLEIQVKSRESWEQAQKAEGIGLTEADDNPELLSSEMNWLRGKLDEMLVRDLGEAGRNCDHGNGWHGLPPARLLSAGMDDEDLLASLPRLVLGIQQVLSHAANDWIVELLSEAGERGDFFTIRIHPDKVVVSEEFAENVDRLLSREG